MTAADEISACAVDVHQQILTSAEADEEGVLQPDLFTQWMISVLTDAGEVNDGDACYYQARGIEVSGYSFDEEESTLDLFITRYTGAEPPVTVPRSDVETGLKRLREFFNRAQTGLHLSMEEACPAFDMAQTIYQHAAELLELRLFFLTDGLTTVEQIPTGLEGSMRVSSHVWDIRRIHRALSSGKTREPISVDFVELCGQPLPCVKARDGGGEYSAYLAVVPGQVLADIYDRYGPRLLERNVRSFLQTKGKINQAIRDTIRQEPSHFLAFNNGISITASSLQLDRGGGGIVALTDMQVVNGGQTTALIHSAARRDKADLSALAVAAKITVVDPELLDTFVPQITRSANTQNRVSEADFSANDPFHIAIEQFSRTVWAPAMDGTQRQTRWFYERARGQYQDELAREGTPARQKQFKIVHPSSQKFTKTDLAKFENSWACLPHTVSLGGEKNFRQFSVRLGERGRFEVTQDYFQQLIAKAILFRQTYKVVQSLALGGYQANIVTYTIAYLSRATAQCLDLDRVWRQQRLPPELADILQEIAIAVREVIIRPPRGGNVTEWCKRKECWEAVSALAVTAVGRIPKSQLISLKLGEAKTNGTIDDPDPAERELISRVAAIPAGTWLQLSHWAKETNNLQSWQRSIAYSLGNLARQGRLPSRKQATQAVRILENAQELGFAADEPV
jgi:hypothetical protein